MTQVDFYVLPQSGSFTVGEAVGRLAEKALSRGHRIFVHVSDEQQGHHLDSELWAFRLNAQVRCSSGTQADPPAC